MKEQIETLQETNAGQAQQIARLVAADRITQFNRATKPEKDKEETKKAKKKKPRV